MARDVVKSFADWAGGRPGLEPDVVQTLVDLKATYLNDAQPTRWRSGDLGVLLLDWVPRKVSADDEWYASVVPTTRAFLTRLHSTGQLHGASAPLSSLLAELDDVAAEFPDAVHDPSRYGMAKSVLAAVGPGDGDLPDAAQLEEAMARFNALPFEQRDAALAGFFQPDDEDDDDDENALPAELPAVRLAPVPELAAAARASVTIRALQQLDEWLGAGRAVTATAVLTLKEARSLQEALGWEGVHSVGPAPRSAHDMPRLSELWTVATETGVVDVRRTRAQPGAARPILQSLHEVSAHGDEQVLGLWQQAFDTLLRIVPDVGWFAFDEDDVADAVLHAVVAAYEDDDHTLGDLLEELFGDALPQESPEIRQIARSFIRRHLVEAFTRLAELGAVTLVTDDDDFVSLTPLGVHGLRRFVLARGGEAPVVEDVTDLPADRAAVQILMATPALARELALEWLAPRERGAALRELAGVLHDLPAGQRRQLLIMLLTMDGVPGALEELCGSDPLLGPLVRAAIAEASVVQDLPLEGLDDPDGVDEQAASTMLSVLRGLAWRDADLPPAERDVLVVDAIARAVVDLDPPVHAEDVDPDYWSLLDESTVLRMQGSAHPEADVVIAAIATGHPAGRIRKAGKKVQHKRATVASH